MDVRLGVIGPCECVRETHHLANTPKELRFKLRAIIGQHRLGSPIFKDPMFRERACYGVAVYQTKRYRMGKLGEYVGEYEQKFPPRLCLGQWPYYIDSNRDERLMRRKKLHRVCPLSQFENILITLDAVTNCSPGTRYPFWPII